MYTTIVKHLPEHYLQMQPKRSTGEQRAHGRDLNRVLARETGG